MSIIFAILIFSFLIFIHEFGHFITAKLFGIQVNEFSMFMGPAIWKKQIGETQYSIRCIPIGGYCAMEGEDTETDNPRSFNKAKWWKRAIVLAAGATMNFIAGFLIMVILYSTMTTTIPKIDSFYDGCTLAQTGGLVQGDTILEVNGEKVETVSDFSRILSADETLTQYDILVLRDGEEVLLKNVTAVKQEFPTENAEEPFVGYGLTWTLAPANLSLGEIIGYSWSDCVYFGKVVWLSLGMLLSGEAGLSDMSGVVGIVQTMGEVANQAGTFALAMQSLLSFGALIAVNLGVMNLLPIPALDGGRIVSLLLTTVIEKITKKKLNPKYEGYVHAAGMVLLLILMAVIMLKDIINIFR